MIVVLQISNSTVANHFFTHRLEDSGKGQNLNNIKSIVILLESIQKFKSSNDTIALALVTIAEKSKI